MCNCFSFSTIIHCWKCKIRHKDFLSGFVSCCLKILLYYIPFGHNQKPNIHSSSESAHILIHQPSLHSFHCHIKVFSLSLSLMFCIYSLLSCAACLVIEFGKKKLLVWFVISFSATLWIIYDIFVSWAVFMLIFPTLL